MSSVSEALRSVDLFNKNCHLMFNDLCSAIRNKIITTSTLTGHQIILGNTLGEPWIGLNIDKMYSDNRRHYMFKINKNGKDLFYFIMMLVKMRDDLISDKYKDICKKLEVDIEFPLLLVTGIMEPRDQNRFVSDANIRRRWVYQTLMTGIADWESVNIESVLFNLKTSNYDFDKDLNLCTPPGTDSMWCENATFKIRRLTDITDSKKVADIAEELLGMSPTADSSNTSDSASSPAALPAPASPS